MASALFRFIAALGRNMIVANTFGSFALLLLFALGGFILSRGNIILNIYIYFFSHYLHCTLNNTPLFCSLLPEDIKKWWIWGYWISPLMYGTNAMVINEFLGNNWKHVLF